MEKQSTGKFLRLMIALVSLLMLCFGAVFFTACDTNTDQTGTAVAAHTHVWRPNGDHTDATCSLPGQETLVCTFPGCNATTVAYTPTKAHNWEQVGIIEPNAAMGILDYTYTLVCTDCGQRIALTDAHEHSYGAFTLVRPTYSCVEYGWFDRTCTVCGEHEIYAEDPTAFEERQGFEYKSIKELPENAKYVVMEGDSAQEYEANEAAIAPLGHVFAEDGVAQWDPFKAPTCTEKGQERTACTRCGGTQGSAETGNEGYKYRDVEATGHTFPEDPEEGWTITTPAQCNTPGVESRYCTVCGEDETERAKQDKNGKTGIETRPVEALEHDFAGQQWVIDEPATCTTPGSQHMDCKNCNGTIEGGRKTETIEATGHSYPLGLEPGAVYDAEKENEYQSVVTDSSKGRYVAPTCDKAGYYEFYCENKCGEPLKLEVPATGHKFKEGITLDSVYDASQLEFYKNNADTKTPATCTTDGTYVFECENHCGTKVTITEPKLNHAKTTVKEAKDATCTEAGWTRGEICDLCGEVLEKSEEVPAKGHSYAGGQLNANSTYDPAMEEVYKQYEKQDEHVNAECEKEGAYMIYCEHGCGSRIVISIPMTGHDWTGKWIVDQAPTCTTGGTAHKECQNGCGAKLQSNAAVLPEGVEPWDGIQAKGHTWGNWIVDTYTTCLADGAAHLECQECEAQMLSTDPLAAIYKTEEKGWKEEDMGKAYGSHLYLDTEEEWITDDEPTCTAGGTQHRNCTRTDRNTELPCDGQETRQVPAKGHNFGGAKRVSDQDFVNGTIDPADLGTPTSHEDANCQHAAYDEYTCEDCGKTYKVYDGRIGRHHFIDMWMSEEVDEDGNHYYQEPTCTQPGWADRICSICGETGTRTIPATGHHYTELLGSNSEHYKWDAENEDYYYDEDGYRIENVKPAYMGHDEWYSCRVSLKYYYKCDKCNETCVEDTGVYAPHDWVNEYDIPANCLHGRIIYFTCYECGTRSEPVDTGVVGDHTWVEGITVPASCTVPGYKTRRCEVCGTEQISEVLEAPGHQLSKDPIVFPATCTDPEIKEWHCAVCNELIKREVGENLGGHKWVVKSVVPGTCANEGYTLEACDVCGLTRKINTEPARKHMYADEFLDNYHLMIENTYNGGAHLDYEAAKAIADYWVMETVYPAMYAMYPEIEADTADDVVWWIENMLIEAKDPTCTEMGYTNVACIYCHVVKTTGYTSPLGHMPAKSDAVPSTHPCLDGGTLGYYYCTRCGLVYEDKGCTIPITDAEGNQYTTKNVEEYAKPAAPGHTYSEVAIPLQVYLSCLGINATEQENITTAKVCLVCFAAKFEELHGVGTDGEITMNGEHVTLEQLIKFAATEESWNTFLADLDADYDISDCIVADNAIGFAGEGKNISEETVAPRPYHTYEVITPEVGAELTIYIGEAAGQAQNGPAYLPISCAKKGGRLTLVCTTCCATEGTLTKEDYENGKYVFFDMQDLWAHAIAKADENGTYPPTDDKYATDSETELYKAAQKLVIDGFTYDGDDTVYDSLGKYINFSDIATVAEGGITKATMTWEELYNTYIYNPDNMGHHQALTTYAQCQLEEHKDLGEHYHEVCEKNASLGEGYAWECEECGFKMPLANHTYLYAKEDGTPDPDAVPCGGQNKCTVCGKLEGEVKEHVYGDSKNWSTAWADNAHLPLAYTAANAIEDATDLKAAISGFDCTTALYCNNCGEMLVAPKGHTYDTSATYVVLIAETCQSVGLMALPCTECYKTSDGLKATTIYKNNKTKTEVYELESATNGYNVSGLAVLSGSEGHYFWSFTATESGYTLNVSTDPNSGYHAPTCFADGYFDAEIKCLTKGQKVSDFKVNADEWNALLAKDKAEVTIDDIDLSKLLDEDGIEAWTKDCTTTIAEPMAELVKARNNLYKLAGYTTKDEGKTWQKGDNGDETSDYYKRAAAIDTFLAEKITKLEHQWITEYNDLPASVTIAGLEYTHFEKTSGTEEDGWWLVKAATCDEGGIVVRICKQACCGVEAIGGEHSAEFVHELAKHDHNYPLDELDPAYDASKIHDGVAEAYATRELTETRPTCTEAGKKIRICTVCGEEIGSEEIPALGHSYHLDESFETEGTYAPHQLFEIAMNGDGRNLKFYLLEEDGSRVIITNKFVPGLVTEPVPDSDNQYYLVYVYQNEQGANALDIVKAMAAKAPKNYAEPEGGCEADEFEIIVPGVDGFRAATAADELTDFVGGQVWHNGKGAYVCYRCGETEIRDIDITDWLDKLDWDKTGANDTVAELDKLLWSDNTADQTVTLKGNVNLTNEGHTGFIVSQHHITIDLNGYELTVAEKLYFYLTDGGTLTIKNGTINMSGFFQEGQPGMNAFSVNGATLELEGVTLNSDGPIFADSKSTITIKNSELNFDAYYGIAFNSGENQGACNTTLEGVEMNVTKPGSVGVFFVGGTPGQETVPMLTLRNCDITAGGIGVLLRGSVKGSIAYSAIAVEGKADTYTMKPLDEEWESGTGVPFGALVVGNNITTNQYMNETDGTELELLGNVYLLADKGTDTDEANTYSTFVAIGHSAKQPVKIIESNAFFNEDIFAQETVYIGEHVVFVKDGTVQATAETVAAALTEGGTVEVIEDVEFSVQDLGKITEETTLDLNGHTFTLNTCDVDNKNKTLMVESGSLTIRGGDIVTADLEEGETFDPNIASISVGHSATLTLDHVTATLATAIMPYAGANLNVLNSEVAFEENTSYGIATNGSYDAPTNVTIIGSKITMLSPGQIVGEEKGWATTAVLLNKNCDALIKDTTITANTAGIAFRTYGTCTVENVTITLTGLQDADGVRDYNVVEGADQLPKTTWGDGTKYACGGIVLGDTKADSEYLKGEGTKATKLIVKGYLTINDDEPNVEDVDGGRLVTYPAIFAVDADGAATETCTCTVDLTECTNAARFGAHNWDGEDTAEYIVWLVNGATLVPAPAKA